MFVLNNIFLPERYKTLCAPEWAPHVTTSEPIIAKTIPRTDIYRWTGSVVVVSVRLVSVGVRRMN